MGESRRLFVAVFAEIHWRRQDSDPSNTQRERHALSNRVGEQVLTALKRLGVETERVCFPEESHGLSRGGRTDRRVARLSHILRWFGNYVWLPITADLE